MKNELLFCMQSFIISLFLLQALLKDARDELVAIISLCGILANLFVLKQITLFHLEVTASDAFMISGIIGLNLIQEYYGRPATRRAILTAYVSVICYLL